MTIAFDAAIPILPISDVAKARAFYVDFLGMSWDWEHRAEAGLPVFAQVSRGALVLFLSEHPGDGAPGTRLILRLRGLEALQAELHAKADSHARPGIEERPWGWRDMPVADPFGNLLVFSEEMCGGDG